MSRALKWSGIEQFGGRFITLLVGMVLARLLDPAAFGLIASVSVFMTIAQQIVDGGIAQRVIQKETVCEDDYCALFFGGMMICLLIAGLLSLASGYIAVFFGHSELQMLVISLSGVMILMNLGRVQQTIMNREMRFKELAQIRILSVIIGAGVGVFMAMNDRGVWSIVGQQAVTALALGFFSFIRVKWTPKSFVKLSALKDLYAFGLPILVSQSVRSLADQMPNVVIAKSFSPSILGFYDRGRLIPQTFTTTLVNVFTRVNLSALSRLQGDLSLLQIQFYRFSLVALGITGISMGALAVYSEEVIFVLLGEKWLPGVWYAQAVCCLAIVHVFHLLNADLLKAVGKTKVFFNINMFCALLQICFVLCAVPYGIKSIIIADILARAVALVVIICGVRKHSKISIKLQIKVFSIVTLWVLATSVSLIGVKFVCGNLIIKLIVGLGVFSAIGLAWKYVYRNELNNLVISK